MWQELHLHRYLLIGDEWNCEWEATGAVDTPEMWDRYLGEHQRPRGIAILREALWASDDKAAGVELLMSVSSHPGAQHHRCYQVFLVTAQSLL